MTERTRVVLVRHGQTAWNREVRFRGRADLPLDDVGLGQARATGRYLAERWPVVAVYASPMRRAMQTAEAIAAAQGMHAQPFDGLLDIDFGDWEGRSPEELADHDPERLQAWFEAPHTVQFPGGESLDDVRDRVVSGLRSITERHPDQTVAMVGHTVVNRVLLCIVIGVGNDHFWQFQQDTCGVSVFEAGADGTGTLVLLNDTCHLQHL